MDNETSVGQHRSNAKVGVGARTARGQGFISLALFFSEAFRRRACSLIPNISNVFGGRRQAPKDPGANAYPYDSY